MERNKEKELRKTHATFRVSIRVLIIHENKVLLAKTRPDHITPSIWTSIGGHLEQGETFEQTAIREAKEEFNIDICDPKTFCVINNILPDGRHWVSIGTVAEKWQGEVKNLEPHKFSEVKWFDLNKLPDGMFPATENLIERYKTGEHI